MNSRAPLSACRGSSKVACAQPRPQGAFPWLWAPRPQSQGKAPWGRGWPVPGSQIVGTSQKYNKDKGAMALSLPRSVAFFASVFTARLLYITILEPETSYFSLWLGLHKRRFSRIRNNLVPYSCCHSYEDGFDLKYN